MTIGRNMCCLDGVVESLAAHLKVLATEEITAHRDLCDAAVTKLEHVPVGMPVGNSLLVVFVPISRNAAVRPCINPSSASSSSSPGNTIPHTQSSS